MISTPAFHNPMAAAWLPIVGPNPHIVDLNIAMACAGPFMDTTEAAQANSILAALNAELSPQEREVLQGWSAGLSPQTYVFSPSDGAGRIRHVLGSFFVENPLTGRHFTKEIKQDLLTIASRIEGRHGVPFLPAAV
jgi:hypothetical protein